MIGRFIYQWQLGLSLNPIAASASLACTGSRESGLSDNINALREFMRMPMGFGPTPGPRNLPAQYEQFRYQVENTTISMTARVERDALASLLPEGLELPRHALLNISFVQLRNLGWLAGRGYNILALAIPAILKANGEAGNYLPVLWENHPDPIITGREEIGYPKLYAELADPARIGDACSGGACWEGYRFFDFSVTGIAEDENPIRTSAPRIFTQKYIPRSFSQGGADASYLTSSNGPDEDFALQTGHTPDVRVLGSATGEARFAFRRATWQDMPTQYHVVNRLAELSIEEYLPARIIRRTGQDDASAQHALI
jgi:hypothetical protein